jgi:hypothetical protein
MPSQLDYSPFLLPSTPIVQPNAPRSLGPLDGLPELMFAMRKQSAAEEQAKREEELRRQQLAQQASIAGQEDQTRRYGMTLQEQGRHETNARLDRQEAERHINQLLASLADAQASGDFAKVNAIHQELGRAGYKVTERASRYTPQPEGAPSPQNTPPPASPVSPDGLPIPRTPNGAQPYDLESGGNPRALNLTTKASGLYQLMPNQLPPGQTPESFANLSADQQRADYNNRYLPNHGLSPADVQDRGSNYVAIAGPDRRGNPGGNVRGSDADVVYPKGSPGARANPSWDIDGDGQVTRGELADLGRTGAGGSVYQGSEPAQKKGAPPPPGMRTSIDVGPIEISSGGAPSAAQSPIDSMGLPSPRITAAPGPDAEVKGGGRYVITDSAGKTIHEYDRPAIQAEQQKAVDSGLKPLFDTAKTPEEKQAAEAARGFAHGLVGNGFGVREVVLEAMKQYRSAISETGKGQRADAGRELAEGKAVQMDSDRAIKMVSSQFKVPKLNEVDLDTDMGLRALAGNNGLGDMAALGHFMKSMEGRITDADYTRYSNASGLINMIGNILNKAATGEQTPELMAQLKQILIEQKQAVANKKQEAADAAERAVLSGSQGYSDPATLRALGSRARQMILGSGGQPAAGAGDLSGRSDDELMRAFQ